MFTVKKLPTCRIFVEKRRILTNKCALVSEEEININGACINLDNKKIKNKIKNGLWSPKLHSFQFFNFIFASSSEIIIWDLSRC